MAEHRSSAENGTLEALREAPLETLLNATEQFPQIPVNRLLMVVANKLYGPLEDPDSLPYLHGFFIGGACVAHAAITNNLDKVAKRTLMDKARIAPVPFAILAARDAQETQEGIRKISEMTLRESSLIDEVAHIVGMTGVASFQEGQTEIRDEEYFAGAMGAAYLASVYAEIARL